jgi:hypothetical protein
MPALKGRGVLLYHTMAVILMFSPEGAREPEPGGSGFLAHNGIAALVWSNPRRK